MFPKCSVAYMKLWESYHLRGAVGDVQRSVHEEKLAELADENARLRRKLAQMGVDPDAR